MASINKEGLLDEIRGYLTDWTTLEKAIIATAPPEQLLLWLTEISRIKKHLKEMNRANIPGATSMAFVFIQRLAEIGAETLGNQVFTQKDPNPDLKVISGLGGGPLIK